MNVTLTQLLHHKTNSAITCQNLTNKIKRNNFLWLLLLLWNLLRNNWQRWPITCVSFNCVSRSQWHIWHLKLFLWWWSGAAGCCHPWSWSRWWPVLRSSVVGEGDHDQWSVSVSLRPLHSHYQTYCSGALVTRVTTMRDHREQSWAELSWADHNIGQLLTLVHRDHNSEEWRFSVYMKCMKYSIQWSDDNTQVCSNIYVYKYKAPSPLFLCNLCNPAKIAKMEKL